MTHSPTQSLFGGIQSYQEDNHLIVTFLKELLHSHTDRLYNYLNGYHVFGELIVTCDDSNVLINDMGHILRCPISGKILHVEKDSGKYYVYQATPNRLIIDEVNTQGNVLRKDFILNLKNPETISSISTSTNFYVIVDNENNIHMAPKSNAVSSEYVIATKMQAYIGDDVEFDAEVTSAQIFEYGDLLILYLYNSKENFIIRLHISQLSYTLINYDIINELVSCESFDSRAMFFLDAYMQQNPDNKIRTNAIKYLRNDGDKIIVGHVLENGKTAHTLISTDKNNINIICSFTTEEPFYIDKVLPINFKDQRILLAIQPHDQGIKIIPFNCAGDQLAEVEDIKMTTTQIVLLLGQKEINIDKSSNSIVNQNIEQEEAQQFDMTGNAQDEYDKEYEFNFRQSEEEMERKENLDSDNNDDYDDDDDANGDMFTTASQTDSKDSNATKFRP